MNLTKILNVLTLIEYITQAVQLVIAKMKGNPDEKTQ